MGRRDPRVTAYIAKSAPFARPILRHLREVVHDACPEVEETLKWGMPSFTWHGILCGMAAFKQHATFGFWRGSVVPGGNGKKAEDAMGQFGRLTKVSELPTKRVLAGYVRAAMKLNGDGVPAHPRGAPKKKPLPVPADLAAALRTNRRARETFEGFSPSRRRDYIEWITEAKREETRARRLETAIEWMADGKARNWKHERC